MEIGVEAPSNRSDSTPGPTYPDRSPKQRGSGYYLHRGNTPGRDYRYMRGQTDGEGDTPIVWRLSWVTRSLRIDREAHPRSHAATDPLGWDEGPEQERLVHLSKMRNAVHDAPDDYVYTPAFLAAAVGGRGPFTADEFDGLVHRLIAHREVHCYRPSPLRSVLAQRMPAGLRFDPAPHA
jgi:hypothetical protein